MSVCPDFVKVPNLNALLRKAVNPDGPRANGLFWDFAEPFKSEKNQKATVAIKEYCDAQRRLQDKLRKNSGGAGAKIAPIVFSVEELDRVVSRK
jgi:hypothetical protein